jgi:hypothetical protein
MHTNIPGRQALLILHLFHTIDAILQHLPIRGIIEIMRHLIAISIERYLLRPSSHAVIGECSAALIGEREPALVPPILQGF